MSVRLFRATKNNCLPNVSISNAFHRFRGFYPQ
uniref:Uncharacterized protein n=1 Tax=Anopheles dirus TaxID=7168 RepID=A0A182NVX3_9DIPT